jgi:hypothetical protein
MRLLILTLIALCLLSGYALAFNEKINEADAVKAILGEAGGCPYSDKLAIAYSLRNRGHLGGVYGLRSKKVYPNNIVQDAYRAWHESAEGIDTTAGADHWLSAWDLKHCPEKRIKWRHGMVKTLKTGNFTFYRSKTQ